MNTFKLILKGIMLWVTIFLTMFFILGIDAFYDSGYFLPALIAIIIMCYSCYKFLSEKEFIKISMYDMMKLEEEDE